MRNYSMQHNAAKESIHADPAVCIWRLTFPEYMNIWTELHFDMFLSGILQISAQQMLAIFFLHNLWGKERNN